MARHSQSAHEIKFFQRGRWITWGNKFFFIFLNGRHAHGQTGLTRQRKSDGFECRASWDTFLAIL